MAQATIIPIPRLLLLVWALFCVTPVQGEDDTAVLGEAILEPSECYGTCNPGSKCETCEFFPINNQDIRWDNDSHSLKDEYKSKWNDAGCNDPDLGCDINDPTKGCIGGIYQLTSEEQNLVKNIFYSLEQKINIWCPECRAIHERGETVTTKDLPWTDNGKYDSWPLGVGLTDLEGRCLEVEDSAIPTEPYCDPYGTDTKCIQDPNAEWDKIRCRGTSEQFYVHSQGFWTPSCVFFVETPISLIVILAISVGTGLFVLLVVVVIVVWCVKRKTQKRIAEQVEKDLAVTVVEAPQTNWLLSQQGGGAMFANDENAGDRFADQLRKGKVKLPTSKTNDFYGSDGYVKGYLMGQNYGGTYAGEYVGAASSQGSARRPSDLGRLSYGSQHALGFAMKTKQTLEKDELEKRISQGSVAKKVSQGIDRSSVASRKESVSWPRPEAVASGKTKFEQQGSSGSKLDVIEESPCKQVSLQDSENQRADFLLQKKLAEEQGLDLAKAGRNQKSKRNRRGSLRNAEDKQRLEDELEARYGDKATEKKLQAIALANMTADKADDFEMRLAQQAVFEDDSPIPEKSMERPWQSPSNENTPVQKSMEKPWNAQSSGGEDTEGAESPVQNSMELPWWQKDGFDSLEDALRPRYDTGLGDSSDEAKLESDEETPQGAARYLF